MANVLNVQVVAADRSVWSGTAESLVAKTTEGEIGILAGHEPVLALLAPGVVRVKVSATETVSAAVPGGFLSMSEDTVMVLAEQVTLADEVNRGVVEQERDAAGDDESRRWAETRLQLVTDG